MQSTKGFTLIELLVVIGIIGLLSSIVLVSISSARTSARNTRRMAQIREYSKAMRFFADDKLFYPDTGEVTSGWGSYYCLGDYADDNCTWGATTYTENTTLNTDFLEFLSTLPPEKTIISNREGIIYACWFGTNGECERGTMWWLLEGSASCDVYADFIVAYFDNYGFGNTLCNIQFARYSL